MKNITLREVLVSVVIVLIMVGLGFFIAESVHDSARAESERYLKALQVENDEELFDYAIRTQVGDLLSYGTFRANEPVTDELIDGEYFSIIRAEQHYVMRTRTVTYTDANGEIRTRTETYWTWETVRREQFNTETFNYLGRDFDYDTVNFSHHSHLSTVRTSSRVRFRFSVIPSEFSGTLFSRAADGTINDTNLYLNREISNVIELKENHATTSVIVFWVLWTILIIFTVIGFVILKNKYLNNYQSW